MASTQYTLGLRKILDGTVNLVSHDLKMVMVDLDDYTPNLDTDEFLSAITAGARVATSPNLGGKSFSIDTTPNPDEIVFDCNDFVFSSVSGDPTEALVLYRDTGDPATSPLIAFFDGASVAITPNGNNVNCVINANGLMRWRRA